MMRRGVGAGTVGGVKCCGRREMEGVAYGGLAKGLLLGGDGGGEGAMSRQQDGSLKSAAALQTARLMQEAAERLREGQAKVRVHGKQRV
eukprot:662332-Pleurochrysis_carterae.AAC.1